MQQIGGHDDGALQRLSTLGKEIRQKALRAAMDEVRFTVTVPAELRSELDEFIQLQGTFMPAASFSVSESKEELTLEIAALPPAFCQVLSDEYAELL